MLGIARETLIVATRCSNVLELEGSVQLPTLIKTGNAPTVTQSRNTLCCLDDGVQPVAANLLCVHGTGVHGVHGAHHMRVATAHGSATPSKHKKKFLYRDSNPGLMGENHIS